MNFTKYNVSSETAVRYDAGLREYMLKMFNYMAIALAITGFTAFFSGTSETFFQIMYSKTESGVGLSPLGWVIQLSPLFLVFFFSFKIHSMSAQTALITFIAYSVLMGLSLSSIFLVYSSTSITRTFLITASLFGAMSLYGYTTKKDLTSLGSFLFMGLIGILLASLVNMFMKSSAFEFAISVIGVLVFTGLTAYDVQKLKNLYLGVAGLDSETANKVAIQGALTLYMDFVNLFLMLLRFFGSRRN